MTRGQRISDLELLEIVRLHSCGAHDEQIAKVLHRGARSIRRVRKHLGLPPRRSPGFRSVHRVLAREAQPPNAGWNLKRRLRALDLGWPGHSWRHATYLAALWDLDAVVESSRPGYEHLPTVDDLIEAVRIQREEKQWGDAPASHERVVKDLCELRRMGYVDAVAPKGSHGALRYRLTARARKEHHEYWRNRLGDDWMTRAGLG